MAEITAIVVGNIGSGKSTFLSTLQDKKTGFRLLPLLSMPGEIKVVKESPEILEIVDKKFYPALEQKNNDLLFVVELDILNARIKQIQANMRQGGIVFNERCPYEDRYVFVPNLYDSGLLLKNHYEIYKREYEYSMKSVQPPDLLIYLYTKPETAFKRRMDELKKGTGGLPNENKLTLDYIKRLHDYYENMINNELPKEIPYYKDVLLIIDADKDFAPKDLLRFHNYIEERAHRLLMKREYYRAYSIKNVNKANKW